MRVISPCAQWALRSWTHNTGITVSGAVEPGRIAKSLYVQCDLQRRGVLLLKVRATRKIELQSVAVEFAAPFELRDPAGSSFFAVEGTSDRDYPFQAVWRGRVELGAGVSRLFALSALFPVGRDDFDVRVAVRARRVVSEVGGFEGKSRTQIDRKPHVVSLVGFPVTLEIPPGEGLGTEQPFLATQS